MRFNVRAIEECVADFQRSSETSILEQTISVYDIQRAWAGEPLAELAANPPIASVYLVGDPLTHSETIFETPREVVEYMSSYPAVGTWNAQGNGVWAASGNDWIVVDVELEQEQADADDYFDEDFGGDFVELIFALFRVGEGYAAAIWPRDDKESLAKVMGLEAWPTEGFEPCDVWCGE